MQRKTGRAQRFRILDPILLVVHDDEIGSERDDRRDIRVLGSADGRDAGEIAEPCARDRRDSERDERLGRRRHQRHDPKSHMAPSLRHPWLRCVRTVSHAVEQLRLLRLELFRQ